MIVCVPRLPVPLPLLTGKGAVASAETETYVEIRHFIQPGCELTLYSSSPLKPGSISQQPYLAS